MKPLADTRYGMNERIEQIAARKCCFTAIHSSVLEHQDFFTCPPAIHKTMSTPIVWSTTNKKRENPGYTTHTLAAAVKRIASFLEIGQRFVSRSSHHY